MKNKIKYSKDLECLKIFVDSIGSLIPLPTIKSIRGYKVKRGYTERTYGSTIKRKTYPPYTINLLAYSWSKKDKIYKPQTMEVVLTSLAHELAHVVYFDAHDYKHFRLEALILLRFSDILKKLDVKDTSGEFNNLDTKPFKEKLS